MRSLRAFRSRRSNKPDQPRVAAPARRVAEALIQAFETDAAKIAAEAALDGIYVIRTSVAEKAMSAEAAVLNFKKLAEVERGFRALKGIDMQVRPIRHRLETRVKAHIFLSFSACSPFMCNGIWSRPGSR